MKKEELYSWFQKAVDLFIKLFLIFVIPSSFFAFCIFTNINRNIAIIFGIVMLILLFFCRNKINNFLNKLLSIISQFNSSKLLFVLVFIMIIIRIFFSVFISLDFYYGEDISKFVVDYVDNYINGGLISNTIGDNYLVLFIHLLIIRLINLPDHIGLFLIFLASIIILYLTFYDVIGANNTFICLSLYGIMPSTILFTFYPSFELLLLFYISLFLFLIKKLISNNNNKMFLIIPLILVTMLICKCLSTIGCCLIIVFALLIFFGNISSRMRILCSIILVLSVSIVNIYSYSFSYQWRTKEQFYKTILYGSNANSNGRFIENYDKYIVEDYLQNNNLKGTHENQDAAYRNEIENNLIELLSQPTKIINLAINKFSVLYSGNHYSIELLYNSNGISKNLYLVLLGINEIIYIICISVGIIRKAVNNIIIYITKLVILLCTSFLMIGESLNRYFFFLIPFIYIICLSNNGRKN